MDLPERLDSESINSEEQCGGLLAVLHGGKLSMEERVQRDLTSAVKRAATHSSPRQKRSVFDIPPEEEEKQQRSPQHRSSQQRAPARSSQQQRGHRGGSDSDYHKYMKYKAKYLALRDRQ